MIYRITLITLLAIVYGCADDTNDKKLTKVFNPLSVKSTGIDFYNKLKENDSMNYFNYTSIYMGGGVSVGDINNDGLIDIFFTGNQVENKLYLNKGNLKFEDITHKSGLAGDQRWYTGSTMADVNGDGYLDIYCSVAGLSAERRNQLYINKQDGTFIEMGEKYGVDDGANSTQGTFFDYDNDGDLDLYVGNYPIANVNTPNYIYKNRMQNVTDKVSDKLYRNEGDIFTDISEEAGVKSYGFSLGVSAGDLNNDGWQDLYISSDYSIPDYFYINNGDGTFKSVIEDATGHTSFYGMGIDIADVNNDGFLDVFQADMDAMNNRRQKANMSGMNPQVFNEIIFMGFHYQYMHNCFQLNTGISKEGVPQFSNVSRLTGTSSTDWSWGPVFADFNNDGLKDLFVTNGVRREINNTDFFNSYSKTDDSNLSDLEKSLKIPSEKIDNFMFKNNGQLDFEKINKEWGIEYKGFSNGVAYADLDNDGDLELIINNVDDYASIYENTSSSASNFLSVALIGNEKNKFGLGTRVFVTINNDLQMQELTLTRGFQSSVAPRLHFGIQDNEIIDELKVIWPNGKSQILNNVKANQFLELSISDSKLIDEDSEKKTNLFTTVDSSILLEHKHEENDYDDYLEQVLLPHKMSSFGPAMAVGDLNGDEQDDFFVGGSHGNSGTIYIQSSNGFLDITPDIIKKDRLSEDVDAMIFDADSDGDNDLYVVSGGYEFSKTSQFYQDRLYINDGKGNFTKSSLPKMLTSGSRVYHADFNKDGKNDVLVLGRQIPKHYPLPANSYVLINKSTPNNVVFSDETETMASTFKGLGMATSAVVTDFDNDTWQDIIIVGEWMPIRIFKNMQTHFEEVSSKLGINEDSTGWWWSIKAGDFDNDGDSDFIVGNNGLNYKYKATEDETFDIYVKDFDNNNSDDIVLSYYSEGKQVPLRGRSCSSQQIPGIKQKFKDYNSFSEATLVDVYTKEELDESLHYQVKSFASIYLENKGDAFESHQLPVEAQFSSINQVLIEDYNKDGSLDMLIAGNLYVSEVETPRNDAGFGYYFEGNGKGDFKAIPSSESGVFIKGDTKDLVKIKINNEDYIIAVKNNDYLQFIKVN
ncbi:VCBS repeat-containing protein [Winogradskyella flava]|uniref:VCBS repeat-containing protein n=1 Tax=Winogradskyella flava TaxID=1884876 RepID=UPI0024939278|nr:FG-GAP-like repeat-containing protein [Winogradskyella flava]